MSDNIEVIAGATAAMVLWLGWALFSETRHNHGFWVAFMLPLSPIIIPLLWLVFITVKYVSLLVFLLRGRRDEHEEFMRKFKNRSGVFILF
jgi:hypothetical protein